MTDDEEVSAGLRKLIDAHGHAFQYAALRCAQELAVEQRSRWTFYATEIPVEVKGSGTRVDFVLEHRDRPIFLVVECKRVNPRKSRWGFARAPFVHRERFDLEPYVAERVEREGHAVLAEGICTDWRKDVYHVAYEMKVNEKGEAQGGSKNAIEEASTQVIRSMNGFASFLLQNTKLLGTVFTGDRLERKEAILFPVIFTTADLWTTEANLSTADPLSGELTNDLTATAVDWLIYQYNMSPGLRHGIQGRPSADTIGKVMDRDYIRTISIVSAKGIPAFLREASDFEGRL